ncbi:MAG: type II toxin-antitoxin system VapB family antitoxin [Gemmatimonadales bacterium]
MARKGTKSYAKAKASPKLVREPAAAVIASSGLRRASLFMNGRSQAVRLPKEFRFDGDHVFVKRDGDRIILMPYDDRTARLLAAFGSAPDFPDRDQGTSQERPELDEFFK